MGILSTKVFILILFKKANNQSRSKCARNKERTMNEGIPNSTPEKNTMEASRFTACNKPKGCKRESGGLDLGAGPRQPCVKLLGLNILITALHIAASARSGTIRPKPSWGEAIFGPPAPIWQRCRQLLLFERPQGMKT